LIRLLPEYGCVVWSPFQWDLFLKLCFLEKWFNKFVDYNTGHLFDGLYLEDRWTLADIMFIFNFSFGMINSPKLLR